MAKPNSGTSSPRPIPIPRRSGSTRSPKRAALPLRGGLSCSGRYSPRRAGAIRRSISIPSKAATCGATCSASATRWVPLKRPEPFPQNSLLAARSRWRSKATALELLTSSLYRRIRPRPADLRSRDARGIAGEMRPRPRRDAAAGPKRGEQSIVEGAMRPRRRDWRHRRALSRHRGPRALLGQRSARTGAGLGGAATSLV